MIKLIGLDLESAQVMFLMEFHLKNSVLTIQIKRSFTFVLIANANVSVLNAWYMVQEI